MLLQFLSDGSHDRIRVNTELKEDQKKKEKDCFLLWDLLSF